MQSNRLMSTIRVRMNVVEGIECEHVCVLSI